MFPLVPPEPIDGHVGDQFSEEDMAKKSLFRREFFTREAGEEKGVTEGYFAKERVIVGECAIGPIDKPNGRIDDRLEDREQVRVHGGVCG